jgi:hypothetical protein
MPCVAAIRLPVPSASSVSIRADSRAATGARLSRDAPSQTTIRAPLFSMK